MMGRAKCDSGRWCFVVSSNTDKGVLFNIYLSLFVSAADKSIPCLNSSRSLLHTTTTTGTGELGTGAGLIWKVALRDEALKIKTERVRNAQRTLYFGSCLRM